MSCTYYRIHRDGEPDSYRRRHINLEDAQAALLAMSEPETLEIREYTAAGKLTHQFYRPGPELLTA